MVSGGFDGENGDNGGNDALNKISNAGKSAGRLASRGVKKAGQKGAKAAGDYLTKLFSNLPKKLLVITVSACLGFTAFFIIAFEATDQNEGAEQNLIDNNNAVKVSSTGDTEVDDYSPANAACLAYYETLSKQKSVYQINDDGDLILASDDDAKTDYFKNDDNFYIDPYLLFSMNKYLFAESNYVLPELFLNPVYYDEDTLELLSLTDDNGTLICTSAKRDGSGNTTGGEVTSVADYGIASVVSYKTETMTETLQGTYIMEDYYNEETKAVEQRDISESFSFEISSEDYDVLDTAITMAGTITYNYVDTEVKSESFEAGSSSDNEIDNVYKILYDTYSVTTYYAVNTYGNIIYFDTEEELNAYLEEDEGYIGRTYTETYNLYKYRSSDSGIYTSFVDFSSTDTNDCGNDYIYDYLTHFSTYEPVITRTYDTLTTITSKASSSIYQNVATYGTNGTTVTTGAGSTTFEQLYNGSMKETIETIWDGLLAWGYSEEQAAAVLANMTAESGFNTEAVNASSGAYGLCQWLGERYDKLDSFASASGTEISDLVTQIQYACMELDSYNDYSYAVCQWITTDPLNTWENSNDVSELAEAVFIGFERPCSVNEYARSSKWQKEAKTREKNALAAYNLLKGQTFGHEIEVISPSGSGSDLSDTSVSSATYTMSDKDKETFYKFYTAVDLTSIYDGDYKINYYTNFLTSDEADSVIILANSYIEGISYDKSSLNLDGVMWSSNFINDLSGEYDGGITLASTLDGVDISSVTELADLDFIFPVDLSGYNKISSKFGARTSPTAGASSNHKSIDISCSSGTAVYAAQSGTVETATYSSSAGYYIVINHGTNANGEVVKTTYMHNSELLVKVGDTVTRGQQIAKSGSTGVSTGPHLDFRVTINGVYYNSLYVFGTTDVPALKNGNLTTFNISVDSSFLTNLYYTESTGFVTP